MTESSMKIMITLAYLILVIKVNIIPGKTEQIPCPTTTSCYCYRNKSNHNVLNCRDRKLTEIPRFRYINVTFDDLTFSTSLERPNLNSCQQCNRITKIPSRAFSNLKVKRIDLTKNYVSHFEADAFAGVEDILEELFIEGNGVISIPFTALIKLNHLTFLQIWNFGQSINSTWNFTKMTTLELHMMKDLSHIAENTFLNKLPKLTSLSIAKVPLNNLPVAALSKLKLLTTLKIQNTNITRIYTQSFTNLTQLKELEISHNNNLKFLDETCFAGLNATLQVLDLSYNSLSAQQVFKVFSVLKMTELTELKLHYNYKLDGLNGLQGKTFKNLESLSTLQLEYCNIRELHAETFYGLKSLKTLILSYNKIKYIEPTLFSFSPVLYDLRLNIQDKNEWLNFPIEAIDNIKNTLEYLNLDMTLLNSSQIWIIVEQLPKLQELKLSETNLKSIPDFAFTNSHSLKRIFLENNSISQLSSASFWGLQDTLELIDLQKNNLTIDKCVFDNFTRLPEISFTWHCDCQLLWLVDIIKKGEQQVLGHLQCASPEDLKDKNLNNLTADQLHCPSNYTEHSCPTYNYTTVTQPSYTTPDTAQKTSTPVTKIYLSIISKEAYKITLAWDALIDRSSITGFVLQYKSFEDNISKTKKFHRETFHHTLEDLTPNTKYEICIHMEINKTIDTKSSQCLWENTKKVEVPDSQNQSSPVLIGISVGVVLFILAIVIIIIVVILKKRTNDQTGGYATAQDVKVSVIPNNYTDLRNLPQSTCLNDRDQRMHENRLAQTNLAPSSLNAGQLLRSTSDPNRPLPEIPIKPGPSDACNMAPASVFYKENTNEIYIDI